MFPAPTIDSSEYTFGDTVGAAGCSKSRERDGKVPRAHERFVIARACFIVFHSRLACRWKFVSSRTYANASYSVRTKVRKRNSQLSHTRQITTSLDTAMTFPGCSLSYLKTHAIYFSKKRKWKINSLISVINLINILMESSHRKLWLNIA